ncbi:MAG: threonine synthase [Deltaproteobacteria bacterium]|nr:threonine synthase [Deltaproteobacteria bacterium]
MTYWLRCTDCGREYREGEVEYLCTACAGTGAAGTAPRGVLRIEYGKVTGAVPDESYSDSRRWHVLLPLRSPESMPPLPVGPTPLHRAERLGKELGLARLVVKDDTVLPTGSLKDRASSVVVAKARELGRDTITTASTGNAAVALAAMAASVGLRAVILVPKTAPIAKRTQMLVFGATVVPVEGTYDDAYALSLEATRVFGWYNRSTAYNPLTVDGKKTVAFEIWEQLGRKAPDAVLVPTGDGVILAGVHKGFGDLRDAGLVDRLPRLYAAQAEGSAAIVRSLDVEGEEVPGLARATTIADSISVGVPAAGRWAKRALRETGGGGIVVTDGEIVEAIALLGRTSGIFCEPAAAAAIAGARKAAREGLVGRDETVVVLVTGNGLKDVAAAERAVRMPEAIVPTVEALGEALGGELKPPMDTDGHR